MKLKYITTSLLAAGIGRVSGGGSQERIFSGPAGGPCGSRGNKGGGPGGAGSGV